MAKQQTRGLTSGDTRIARLARWLGQVPSGAQWDTLNLEVKQDGEYVLIQAWERSRIFPDLANEIDSVVTNAADECGEYLKARVVWCSSEDAKYFTEFPMRVQPADMDASQAFTGEGANALVQTQRHLEFMAKLHVGGFGSAIRALEGSNAHLEARADELAIANAELRAQNVQLQDDLAKATALLEEFGAKVEQMEAEKPQNDQTAQVFSLATEYLRKQGGGGS